MSRMPKCLQYTACMLHMPACYCSMTSTNHEPCIVYHATCTTQHALCTVHHTTCIMHTTSCIIHHVSFIMLHTHGASLLVCLLTAVSMAETVTYMRETPCTDDSGHVDYWLLQPWQQLSLRCLSRYAAVPAVKSHEHYRHGKSPKT